VTQTELAKLLGCSKQNVSKHVAKGMPVDSEEEARRWLRNNVVSDSQINRGMIEQSVVTAPSEIDTVPQKIQDLAENAPIELPTEQKECREALKEIQVSRKLAFSNMVKLSASENKDGARRWAMVHQMLTSRQASLEKQLRDILERDSVTVLHSQATARFRKFLFTLKTICDAMPSALCAKANPSDRLLALRHLEEWRDKQLYKVLNNYEKHE